MKACPDHQKIWWQRPQRWWIRLQGLFGFNLLGTVMLVYYLQGSRVGFTYMATDYYYKDSRDGLGLSPAEAQALIAVSGLPWGLKPLYGVLCDAIPIFGTHRRGYLGLFGGIGTLGYALLALLPPHRFGCTAALFLCSLGSAFCDVVVDAMVAQAAKREPATAPGNLQSLAWGAYALGSVLGSILGGALFSLIGARAILGVFGAVYSLTIPLAVNLKEPCGVQPASRERFFKQARLLYCTVRTPLVAKVVLYTFMMYAAVPVVSSGTFYFWTDQDACQNCESHDRRQWSLVLPSYVTDGNISVGCQWFADRGQTVGAAKACTAPLSIHASTVDSFVAMNDTSNRILSSAWDHCPQACSECVVNGRGCIGFSAAFLGATRAISYVAYLGGVVLYNAFFKHTAFRTIFFWAWVAHGLSLVPDLLLVLRINTALGLPDELFLVGDHILYNALNQLKHLPFLVLAAQLCPASIEATFFASLMSVANWGTDTANFTGAAMLSALGVTATNFELLWLAITIRIVSCTLPAILALWLVPTGGPADAVRQFNEQLATTSAPSSDYLAVARESIDESSELAQLHLQAIE